MGRCRGGRGSYAYGVGYNLRLEEKVKEQGEKVRRLKAEQAPKEQVRL